MIPTVPGTPGHARAGLGDKPSVWFELPGLLARYRNASSSAFPDSVGGVGDGTHTGSPSTAASGASVGMSYDGATQYTTIGGVADLAYIHQTWTFAVSAWFRWDGPSDGTKLSMIIANAVSTNDRGFYLAVEDRAVGGGPLALRGVAVRAQGGVLADTVGGTLVVGQLHHALLTSDGSTQRLYLDGVLVDSTAVLATQTGNADDVCRIGDVVTSSPTFALEGDVFDVAFASADWSDYAAAIYEEGPG